MKTDEDSLGPQLPLSDVVKLSERGRLSSGRAAELAGITRVEFLLALRRYKVFPLQDELRELEDRDA